ncbi:MAG: hypothetical protein JHC33_09820 [Ignisphaera sp.]|nr:hypothetical protein [Ignisphaera sp.]
MPHEQPWLDKDTFIEEFFDSNLYKDVLARNDKSHEYVVRTTSDCIYYLKEEGNIVTQLHFPEEIEDAITNVKNS